MVFLYFNPLQSIPYKHRVSCDGLLTSCSSFFLSSIFSKGTSDFFSFSSNKLFLDSMLSLTDGTWWVLLLMEVSFLLSRFWFSLLAVSGCIRSMALFRVSWDCAILYLLISLGGDGAFIVSPLKNGCLMISAIVILSSGSMTRILLIKFSKA